MKYLETKHERDSAKITTLIVLILLLLLFVVGPAYLDPPEEYGVAVNFGNSNVGSGNVQPDKPVKSVDVNIKAKPQEAQSEAQSEPQATKAEEVVDDVLTQETEEAIQIRKQKEAEAQAKAKAERIAKAKADAEAKKKREEEEKKKKLEEMMGGLNTNDGEAPGGEGDTNEAGDKGQLDGNPYAPSYFGDPGAGSGGKGYGLGGRGKPTRSEIIPECQEEGRVVVEIHVNQAGKVIYAKPGVKGTTGDACLFAAAKKAALSHKWPADSKAPTKQIGFVKLDYSLGQ